MKNKKYYIVSIILVIFIFINVQGVHGIGDINTTSDPVWGRKQIETDAIINFLKSKNVDKSEVIVAVLDTGIDLTLPVFKNRIVSPYNMADKNTNVDDVDDDYYHGTYISGIIADCTPASVKIMPIKIYNKKRKSDSKILGDAIYHALNNGANIINISNNKLSMADTDIYSNYLQSAIDEAINRNCTVIVSAGDQESNCSNYIPCNNKNAIIVTAVDKEGIIYDYSNYGSTVSFSAPGVDVGFTGGNDLQSGSSFAAAHVSAAAALTLMYSPDFSPKNIKNILSQSCNNYTETQTNKNYGVGIINLKNYINVLRGNENLDFGICLLSGEKYTIFEGESIDFILGIKTPYPRVDSSHVMILHGSWMKYSDKKWDDQFHSSWMDGGSYTQVFRFESKDYISKEGTYLVGFALFYPDNYSTGNALCQVTCTVVVKKRVQPMISAGYYSSFALKEDGTVWSWGLSRVSDLGQKSKNNGLNMINVSSPSKIEGLENITSIRGTICSHSLAIDKNGDLWAWGLNDYGQLGIGKDTGNDTFYEPQKVMIDNVVEVSTGFYHTIALKSDGTVYTWGQIDYINALGYEGDRNQFSPKQVGGLSDIIKVSASYYSSFALKSDGTVWGWGRNHYAQISGKEGTYGAESCNITKPTKIEGISNVVDISVGEDYVLALKEDGSVWSWGRNKQGQLGNGTQNDKYTPQQIVSLKNIKSICAGGANACAVDKDGYVWVWGRNIEKQLLSEEYNFIVSPVKIKDLKNIRQASIYFDNIMVLDENGYIWSWGTNKHGEIGNGSTVKERNPTKALINLKE